MKDKSKLVTIILISLTILVVVLTYILNKRQEALEIKNDIYIVSNYSNFYTVNSCLYRTVTNITSGDKENILLLLNDNYKKKNKINKNNVMGLFETIDSSSTFVSRKMYYEKLNDNITKYYVYGNIQQDVIQDDGEIMQNQNKKVMYFIVYLDNNNKTFSIEPYSGEIFIGGGTNE